MAAWSADIEVRVRSLVDQLQVETGVMERIVYKLRNQHRRCPYFRYILKVRRDIRLLMSVGMRDIFSAVFPIIIQGKKKPSSATIVSKSGKKKHSRGNRCFAERLLGTARLLSQMAEPILKAAIQISFLLSKSFFTAFTCIMLALLGRIRALIEQLLVDIVTIYNELSSLLQKDQFTESSQVPKRLDSANWRSVLTLECVWEVDKMVLKEKNLDMQELRPKEPSANFNTPKFLTKDKCFQNEKIAKPVLFPEFESAQKRPRREGTPSVTPEKKLKSVLQRSSLAMEDDPFLRLLVSGTPVKTNPGSNSNQHLTTCEGNPGRAAGIVNSDVGEPLREIKGPLSEPLLCKSMLKSEDTSLGLLGTGSPKHIGRVEDGETLAPRVSPSLQLGVASTDRE